MNRIATKVTNNTKHGKTFTWIKEGLWIDAGQTIELPYDLCTKAQLDDRGQLLDADLAEGFVSIEYRTYPHIKVSQDLGVDAAAKPEPVPEPAKSRSAEESRKESEKNAKIESELNKPEFLKLDKDPLKKLEYDINDVLWNKESAKPVQKPVSLVLTSEREAAIKQGRVPVPVPL